MPLLVKIITVKPPLKNPNFFFIHRVQKHSLSKLQFSLTYPFILDSSRTVNAIACMKHENCLIISYTMYDNVTT